MRIGASRTRHTISPHQAAIEDRVSDGPRRHRCRGAEKRGHCQSPSSRAARHADDRNRGAGLEERHYVGPATYTTVGAVGGDLFAGLTSGVPYHLVAHVTPGGASLYGAILGAPPAFKAAVGGTGGLPIHNVDWFEPFHDFAASSGHFWLRRWHVIRDGARGPNPFGVVLP